MTLTPKQLKVLTFIQSFEKKKGYLPSQKEIANHFNFSSLGTVQDYLKYLEKHGHIERKWNAKRATQVIQQSPPQTQTAPFLLPLLGRVAAGRPLEFSISDVEIEVPEHLLRRSGEHYVLQVSGLSMIGEGILDGDYVIIRKQNTAHKGETVVAMIENEATIKKYHPKNGGIELLSANPAFDPIVIDSTRKFEITGILTGVIRKV